MRNGGGRGDQLGKHDDIRSIWGETIKGDRPLLHPLRRKGLGRQGNLVEQLRPTSRVEIICIVGSDLKIQLAVHQHL